MGSGSWSQKTPGSIWTLHSYPYNWNKKSLGGSFCHGLTITWISHLVWAPTYTPRFYFKAGYSRTHLHETNCKHCWLIAGTVVLHLLHVNTLIWDILSFTFSYLNTESLNIWGPEENLKSWLASSNWKLLLQQPGSAKRVSDWPTGKPPSAFKAFISFSWEYSLNIAAVSNNGNDFCTFLILFQATCTQSINYILAAFFFYSPP